MKMEPVDCILAGYRKSLSEMVDFPYSFYTFVEYIYDEVVGMENVPQETDALISSAVIKKYLLLRI